MPLANADTRMTRALRALDGLSVGDAFGQCFFPISVSQYAFEQRIANHQLPPAPWPVTDDTEMATAIVDVLRLHGTIDQDALAHAFATRYARDPSRGYGGTAHRILREIGQGIPWQHAAGEVFNGAGSMGNGGAMRVAPLGAFFADDIDRLIEEARRSAVVTHAHPDGQAGAIAVALAAAFAWNHRGSLSAGRGTELLEFVTRHVPPGETAANLRRALDLPLTYQVDTAVSALGNGLKVSAPDTVPFALWCAARHLDDFPTALWTTVSGAGDMDTTCAIVGGIVALSSAIDPLPWLEFREPLRFNTVPE